MKVVQAESVVLYDHEPADLFLEEVLEGLAREPKTLPCKFFYDERGSQLFERICALDDYYPTRTELGIMREHAGEMVGAIGPRCRLVELGSGASVKTRILLDHLVDPVAYVPIDISGEFLLQIAEDLARLYPDLLVQPVCADYTRRLRLPPCEGQRSTVVYFPGSTIGNLQPGAAAAFLARLARLCGAGGGVLLGVDLRKDPAILERAYDDVEGVTARFNLNLLERINRELGGDFEVEQFGHRAGWVPEKGCVRMYLVSRRAQRATVAGRTFSFAAGETIHTEDSYKYELEGFAKLAKVAGFRVERVWIDPERLFSVQFLVVR